MGNEIYEIRRTPPLMRRAKGVGVIILLMALATPTMVLADSPGYYYNCPGKVAAYHHGELTQGWPSEVTWGYPGVATSSRDIPFNTVLRCEVTAVPQWASEEYDVIGNVVYVVVVDRMGDDTPEMYDFWPFAFSLLAGKEWERLGKVYVKCEPLTDNEEEADGEVLSRLGTTRAK